MGYGSGTTTRLAKALNRNGCCFTDADVWHPPSSLRQLVAAALSDHRDAVSLMARLHLSSAWEKLLMPAFVYFFAQIYPFSWVNRGSAGQRPPRAARIGTGHRPSRRRWPRRRSH